MLQYTVVIPDDFKDKFNNFLANINKINSTRVISIREVIAIPKERKDEDGV